MPLLHRLKVDSSSIHGYGVIATTPFYKGDVHQGVEIATNNNSALDIELFQIISHHRKDILNFFCAIIESNDNDLSATDYTIGFYTGSTLFGMDFFSGISGLAGAADVILIPEIPYDVDRIVARIKQRRSHGISHNIIVIAEGAYAQGTSEQWIKKGNNPHDGRLGGCGERLAQEISSRDDGEVRVTVLGHIQRGGSPVSFDRILSARYGMAAVDLIAKNDFGKSPVIQGSELTAVPISEMRLRDKSVPSEGEMVRIARTLGVELGN